MVIESTLIRQDHIGENAKCMQLFLLRHAEAERLGNGKLIGGRMNFLRLTENGVRQANALGQRLKKEGIKFDIVYSSPAVRTLSTARIVCRVLGFNGSIMVRDDLQEISHGDWEGKSRDKFYTEEVLKLMRSDPLTYHAPNGESNLDIQNRMKKVINNELIGKLRTTDNGLSVAIFGHSFAFKCLIRGILESDPGLTYKFAVDNCSITELKFMLNGRHPGWHIIRLNDSGHIPKNLRSIYERR